MTSSAGDGAPLGKLGPAGMKHRSGVCGGGQGHPKTSA